MKVVRYEVTLEETLKAKPLAKLREVSRDLLKLNGIEGLSRDELAEKICSVVTLDELIGLVKRYWDMGDGSECTAENCYAADKAYVNELLHRRAPADPDYILYGNWICHPEFGYDKKHQSEIIEAFVARRSQHARWYPSDEDELFSYDSDWNFLEQPYFEPLEDFLEKHGLEDEDDRVQTMYTVVCMLQIAEERPPVILQGLMDKLDLPANEDAARFCELFMDFANNLRRRVDNGQSPKEAIAARKPDLRRPIVKVNPRAAVGRNDPCPCGSGKKFKKCCGMKASKAAKVSEIAQERLSVYMPMRDITSTFVSRHVVPLNTLEMQKAAGERIGITKNGVCTSNADPSTLASVVGDYTAMMDDEFGEPPIRQLIRRESEFHGDALKALQMFKKYRYTWLEVKEAEPGVGVKCHDLLLDKDVFLMEMSFSRDFGVKGMTVCAGVGELPNGTIMILGTLQPAEFENPATVLKIVLAHLGIPYRLPIRLSFADQARFAAETIRRINANDRFSGVMYGG